MERHSDFYTAYLASPAWKLLRLDALAQAAYRCQHCGQIADLEVHHLHYNTLGREALTDLQVLCATCHATADTVRARQTASRQADRLWQARVDGWARKRYGDDWYEYRDCEQVEEAFEAWLRYRGEDE